MHISHFFIFLWCFFRFLCNWIFFIYTCQFGSVFFTFIILYTLQLLAYSLWNLLYLSYYTPWLGKIYIYSRNFLHICSVFFTIILGKVYIYTQFFLQLYSEKFTFILGNFYIYTQFFLHITILYPLQTHALKPLLNK